MAPRYIWKAVDEGRAINATQMELVSRKIAQSAGCMSEFDQEILHCLRDRPLSDIMSIYSVSKSVFFFNIRYFTVLSRGLYLF